MSPSAWNQTLQALTSRHQFKARLIAKSKLKHRKSDLSSHPGGSRASSSAQPCRLLALPRELRDMIYFHLINPPSVLLTETHNFYAANPGLTTWFPSSELLSGAEEPVPYQPSFDSGFITLSNPPPPVAFLLICRTIHAELLQNFYSTTVFEAAPLTSHHDVWRADPTYQKLRASQHLPHIRILQIRIALQRMQKTEDDYPLTLDYRAASYSLQEIGLEDCVLKVQPLVEILVRILRANATSLKVMIIEYVDEFLRDDEDEDGGMDSEWELKSSVLFPFGGLGGMRFQLGEVITSGGEKRRNVLRRKLEERLEALSV